MTAIQHEVTIGDCRLILGDALAVLPELGLQADMVATDVPYRLTSGGSAGGSMTGIFAAEHYDNGGDLMDVVRWGAIGGPIYRACKPDADAYIMANDKNIFAAHAGFVGAGWKFHNLLGWDKGAPTRNRYYMKHVEYVLYLWKGRARTINVPGSKQLFKCPRPASPVHPTQKPVDLMAHYIRNSSGVGDLVLDPFAGSGATVLAALATGRRALGIEVSEEHFAAAAARLERAVAQEFAGVLAA